MAEALAIYSSLGADPDLGELVDMFVSEMPERIDLLLKQYETANWEELRRTAHQIKGAAGSYGFHDLTPAAARLEMSIKEHSPEERIASELNALLDLCRSIRSGAPA